MKKRLLVCLLVLSMVLSGLGLTPARAADNGLIITQVDPQMDPNRCNASDDTLLIPEEDPDEIVEIIVELEGRPVSDTLALSAANLTQTATRQAISDAQAKLSNVQAGVQQTLSRTVGAGQLEYTRSYTLLMNGFAVKTARKNLDVIRETPGVSRAYVASYYQIPETRTAENGLQAALRAVDGKYSGDGTVIAILDTGLDIAHSAFSNDPASPVFTKDYIRGILKGADLNAEKAVPGINADDVFVSNKIPFAFDYGMGDTGVAPINKTQAINLDHGTHVAGIAAGYEADAEGNVTFAGVAPNAQIVAMKVFDDAGTGASTSAILAALEDAYVLGVDAVNLSLGIRSGFTVDEDEIINEVYNRLNDAGIMVIVAAGNETSSSAYNNYGEDLPLTADPDNSIVASPATYPANLAVASVDSDKTYLRYFQLGDENILFTDSETSWLDVPSYVDYCVRAGRLKEPVTQPYEYVMVPGYGAYEDYAGLDVKGKIAVVQRGGTTASGEALTFSTKMMYASWFNAIGVIVYNNNAENPDDYSVRMATNGRMIPGCFVSYNVGQKLAELEGTGVGITLMTDFLVEDSATAGQMSSFTSIGVSPDLRLKPEISAIGGSVYSSIPTLAGQGSYAAMSGTSMASPYVAGASVIVKQRITKDWRIMMSASQAPQMTENLLMSTAQIVVDPATELPYSPRLQGSGQIDLNAAMTSDVCLFTDADAYGDTKPVANLGDDVEKTGVYTVSFYAQNLGITAPVSYDIDVIAMSPDVEERDGYNLMSSQDVLLDYTVSGQTSVRLVPTAPKTEIKLTITLTEDQKKELDQNFENGIFVEGFVRLTPTDSETAPVLSVPFVAFYGDWSQPGMFDYATMLNDLEVPYSNYATAIGTWFAWMSVKLGANLSTNEVVTIKGEHITISPNGDTMMDGVEIASLGLLRNAAAVHYAVTNEAGETLWTDETTNVPKTTFYASNGAMIPATHFLNYAAEPWLGVDSEGNTLPDGQYYYTIQADPVTDHEANNVRDTITFPVYIDTAAPYLKAGTVSLHTNEEGRLIMGLPVADDHILLSATVYQAKDNGSPNFNVAPLLQANYGLEGMEDIQYTLAEVDVTDFAGKSVYLQLEDWGYNISAYLIQIPETFTADTLTLSNDRVFLFTGGTIALIGYNSMNEEELNLTWASSDESVATVDESGVVYAAAPGVATITATTTTGVTATCVVGVEDTMEFTGLSLDFDEMTIDVAFKSRITLPKAYLEPYGFQLASSEVNWTVSDTTIARKVGSDAIWTNQVAGTVTVTAEYQGMTASFDVNVFENTGSVTMYRRWITPTVNYIFTHDCADQLVVGYDAIYALDTAATADDQILTFTNDHPEVAALDKTTTSATANKEMPTDGVRVTGMSPGTATITATATDTTQDSISWMITVVPKRYDGINALTDKLSLCVDSTAQMTDSLELAGENVIPEYNPVFYTSFAPEIVSVSEDGTLTAHKAGTGLIRAMLNTGDYVLISVEVSDHVEEVRNAREATCTEGGYTGDVYCAVCEELLEQGETIPAKGHSWGAWETVESPTCEDKGSEKRICSVCKVTETRDLDPNGHNWEADYTIDKEPTCTEDGSKSVHCKDCDAVKDSTTIPATGHTEAVKDAREATCTEDGYTGDTYCTVCGELVAKGAALPALGHHVVCVNRKIPTAYENGYSGDLVCSRCGKLLEKGHVIPAKGSSNSSTEKPSTPAESFPFTDVPAGASYYDAVKYVYEKGLMNGVGDSKFAPESTLTRAMVVTILYRIEGEPSTQYNGMFTDVADGQWYSNAVEWAAKNKVVNGYPSGDFGPEDPVTREQLATILYRYAQSKGYGVSPASDLSGCADAANISAYAVDAVKWAVDEGILEVNGGMLQSVDAANRAQVAVAMATFHQEYVR